MALSAIADEYFRTMNPLAAKIHEDIEETRNAYENIWDTLTDKEKTEIIDESMIKPEIAIKYALLDTLDFDLNDPPVRRDNLMSFFGREHGQHIIHDDNICYKDEHSAPFIYQTKSQLNLCFLSDQRIKIETKPPSSPPPIMSELEISHSKVVSELKNALKSHDKLKPYKEKERDVTSPTGFLTKFIGNFKTKDIDDRECLVSTSQNQIVASSENFFKTGFKSPLSEAKYDKEYRSSMIKSNSDLSEENRGLLSSSQTSSGTDFQSSETLTESTTLPKTGFDFLDNW